MGHTLKTPSPYLIPSGSPTSPWPLCSLFFFGRKGCPISCCHLPFCVLSGPPLPQLQVLCDVLLPADAGHGGRLWWEGGSSKDTEGHPSDDPHRPLLLLLPLLPTTHAHQVRWEGEAAWKNRLASSCTLPRASAGSLSPASSLMELGFYGTNPVMKGWASRSQGPHTGHPRRGKGSRGRRTPKFSSLKLTVPYKLYHTEQTGFWTIYFPLPSISVIEVGVNTQFLLKGSILV